MSRRLLDRVVWGGLAVLAAMGVVLFPGALDANAPTSTAVVLSPARSGDWYPGMGSSVTAGAPGTWVLEAKEEGLQLISRSLPVHADRCYTFGLTASATGPPAELRVLSQDLRRVIARAPLPATGAPVVAHLARGDRRRVAVGIYASAGPATLTISSVAYHPVPC